MKRNLEIGELDRAILHHGLCLLGCEARKQEDNRMLEHVESLRLMLYPELESQPQPSPVQVPTPARAPQQNNPPPPPPSIPPTASSRTEFGTSRISDKQSGRFYAIQKKSNKRPSEVTAYLASMGFSNYKAITVDHYDECINWLQS